MLYAFIMNYNNHCISMQIIQTLRGILTITLCFLNYLHTATDLIWAGLQTVIIIGVCDKILQLGAPVLLVNMPSRLCSFFLSIFFFFFAFYMALFSEQLKRWQETGWERGKWHAAESRRPGLEPWAAAARTKPQQQRFPMLCFAVVAAVIKRNHTRKQTFVRVWSRSHSGLGTSVTGNYSTIIRRSAVCVYCSI